MRLIRGSHYLYQYDFEWRIFVFDIGNGTIDYAPFFSILAGKHFAVDFSNYVYVN